MSKKALSRRTFLKAAGVSLALPCLDVFASDRARGADTQPRRRMVCICTPLGLHPPFFFPEKKGKDYELTPYLEVLKDFRNDFTVVSGLSHAGMSPGFASLKSKGVVRLRSRWYVAPGNAFFSLKATFGRKGLTMPYSSSVRSGGGTPMSGR